MGAWLIYYRYTQPEIEGSGDPVGWAIVSLKQELAFNGYDTAGFQPDLPRFGKQAGTLTRKFQADHHLEVDGVIGPHTSKELFRKRIVAEQTTYGIPENLVAKQLLLESLLDPGAVGTVDQDDRGMAQINRRAHPEVVDAQAYSAQFAIPWAADYLNDLYDAVGDWDGALVGYNQGRQYGRMWVQAGKPDSGGPRVTIKGVSYDRWVLASTYVHVVKRQTF